MAIRLDAHIDDQHRDQQWHKPVRCAATGNVTIATGLNAGDTIDGVVLAAGDRVLLPAQSAGAENGIYDAGATPARAYDMLAGVQALGAVVRVLEGTANGNTWWQCTNTSLPTIGTTALTWEEVSLGGGAAAADVDAVDVAAESDDSGASSENVQGQLDELYEAIGWSVDSVGSLSTSGSGTPGTTIVDDSTWNEFPGMVRLDASRILIVFRGDGTSHAANGKVMGIILTLADDHESIDTIGAKFTILDDAEDLRVEDGVSIVDGQLVIAFRYYDGADNHDPSLIICDDAPTDFTSTSTWSSPIPLPDPGGSVQEYTQGRVRKHPDGTYILGGGFDSGGDHTVGVWRWTGTLDDPSAASFVTVGSGANDYSEITFEILPDESIRALLRSDTNDDIDMKTSADSGATWSSVSNAYDGHGNPMARYFKSTLGLTVYRDAPNGDTAWRPTTDFGATWGTETILDTTGVRSAYATLLQVTPTAILCVYGIEYDSGGASGTADLFYKWFTDSSTFGADIQGTDEKVKVSSNDTTAGYLNGKLVAGSGVTLTENNNGGDETLTIARSGSSPPTSILLESGHATPFTFDEILQESDGSDFLWASE